MFRPRAGRRAHRKIGPVEKVGAAEAAALERPHRRRRRVEAA